MVGSPLSEFALEMHNRVYIAGELIGAALLLWDFAKSRLRRDPT